ncbi:MAG: hemolysin family protein [Chloroherpetonaceae bacterium]|nr:hemolysin family protein [Chthonomonadaceae bacterium]MDW8206513.1 hemolysin family protein [Chloroherpetonaceae bacterium]
MPLLSHRPVFPATVTLLTALLLLSVYTPRIARSAPDNLPAGATDMYPLTMLPLNVALALMAALLALHTFLSVAELALITVRKPRLRQLVEEGNPRALLVARMLEQPVRLMATTQVGTMLSVAASSALGAIGVAPALASRLRDWAPLSPAIAYAIALVLVLLPLATLALIVGEIMPRSVVAPRSERIALATVRPLRLLQQLLAPAVGLVSLLANLILRPFGGTVCFTTPAVNEEELKLMVEASEEQGVLEAEETEMIHSVLEFTGTVVRKVMTPRIDLTALPVTAPLSELVQTIHESGHSRILIYEGDLDNIVGIVHAKDLLPLLASEKREEISIRDVMRAPYFIPETKRVDDLLGELRRSKQQLAVVRDEYGTTSGLVTIEDLVEEIVGDIQDEYDVEEPMVQVIDETTTILDGKMPLGDVNERMGLEIPEEEADTIGGFVFGLLGHQAQEGESVVWGDVTFIVEATDGKRITKVRLVRAPLEPPAEPEAPAEPAAPQSNGAPSEDSPVEISGVEIGPGVAHRL